MALALIVFAFVTHVLGARLSVPAAFVALVSWSFFAELPRLFFSRYPGTFYLLSTPLNALAQACAWASPLNANRLTNFLSIPAWLFLLRPLAVRRWPSVSLLPFAFLYFFQKDVIYYFTASSLEPWSIVLVLTAVEMLIVDSSNPSFALLSVGMASIIKEQAILVLPWLWLATVRFRSIWSHALLGIAAIVPFATYYCYRRLSGTSRLFQFVGFREAISTHRLTAFLTRTRLQFGVSGLVVLAVVLLLFVVLTLGRHRHRRLFVCLGGAIVCQMFLFYFDVQSTPWIGYPRFQLIAFALVACTLLEVGHRYEYTRPRAYLLTAAAVIFVAQAPVLVGEMRLLRLPDPARNFSEHFDSPVYFPINKLVREAERASALTHVDTITINSSNLRYYTHVLPTAYPAIARSYSLAQSTLCECRKEGEAVLELYVYRTGLNALIDEWPWNTILDPATVKRLDYRSQDWSCRDSLIATCRRTFEKRMPDGSLTGILGVGVQN
jgi:hypothetical protein